MIFYSVECYEKRKGREDAEKGDTAEGWRKERRGDFKVDVEH